MNTPTNENTTRVAAITLLTLRNLTEGIGQETLRRLLEADQAHLSDAWDMLSSDGLVRLDGERCTVTDKGRISFGRLSPFMAAGLTPDKVKDNGFGTAIALLQRNNVIEAAQLLMAQVKRHTPRSASAATVCLDIILKVLQDIPLEDASEDMRRNFIRTVIELADITTYLPIRTRQVCPFLERATLAAQRFGDNRSVAVMHLIHAHILTFASFNISQEADRLFNLGFELGQAIGDADMIEYVSAFLGFRHFLKGEFREAENQFNKVRTGFALPNSQYWWVVFHAMSSAFLGFDRQAIGSLESAWRSAVLAGDLLSATFLRLHLALILLTFGRMQDALEHIDALSEQIDSNSVPILQIRMAWLLMLYHYRTDNMQSTHAMMEKISALVARSGISNPMHHFPWILEILYRHWKRGMPETEFFNLSRELEWSDQAPSRQINATAWRIRGLMATDEENDLQSAARSLKQALKLFAAVGNPVESAKVKLDLADVYARLGRTNSASRLRMAAYATHRFFGQPEWPKNTPRPRAWPEDKKSAAWPKLLKDPSERSPQPNQKDLWRSCLGRLCRRLRIEHGALFAVRNDGLEALARYNLSDTLIASSDFSSYRSWILRHARSRSVARRNGKCGAAVCIPLDNEHTATFLVLLNTYYEEEIDALPNARLKAEADAFFPHQNEIAWNDSYSDSTDLVISPNPDSGEFITGSEMMRQLLIKLKQAASTDAAIHIFGETGVGKELLARYIHRHSGRTGPFVCVHPASMTETLFESAFFGHEKGSFTGATSQKNGFFELANEGTLFIDEVGEMPLSTQAKFLRVLQERTFIRVGGLREIRSNFRLVTATNRNLEEEVTAGNFRMDLFYRISVVPALVPPLRLRGNDCELLAQWFLNHFTKKYNRPGIVLGEAERRLIRAYPWPGNVRELENVIERAVILYNGGRLELSLHQAEAKIPAPPTVSAETETVAEANIIEGWPTLEEIERRYIRLVLGQTRGQIDGNDGAAALLGIGRSTLYAKIRKYGFRLSRTFE